MLKTNFLKTLLVIIVAGFIFNSTVLKAQAVIHPFLIVKEGDYSALQAKAAQAPWGGWKANAISKSALVYDPSPTVLVGNNLVRTKSENMRNIVSGGALAYILDPANRTTYKNRIVTALKKWDDLLNTAEISDPSNIEHLAVGTAFLNSVLALDIIHDDVSGIDLAEIETKLARILTIQTKCPNCVVKNWLDMSPHRQNTYAIKGIWAIYTGADAATITTYANRYKADLYYSMSSSGVYLAGSSYGVTRMDSYIKESKGFFLDVLQFTGKDTTFYSSNQLSNFYEWLYGYSVTPNRKQAYIFGDTYPALTLGSYNGAARFRAYRFYNSGEPVKAAQYAVWSAGSTISNGLLLPYVLSGGNSLPALAKPTSRVFSDGGAWFAEGNQTDLSLAGAMWNIKRNSEFHSHYEMNALSLSSYGQIVLRNVGYLQTKDPYYRFAEWGNTVLINGENHVSKAGAGITEALTGGKLDYASGDSGTALAANLTGTPNTTANPNPAVSNPDNAGKHIRNFVFVHPQDGKNGYWITFDEVSFNTAGKDVNTVWHPNSDLSPTVVSANTEYKWSVNKDIVSVGDQKVSVNIFLGTPPSSVIVKSSPMRSSVSGSAGIFQNKYIYPTYNTSGNKKNIVTVIYPSDTTHATASMSRVTGTGYSGASVDMGGSVIDTALESSGAGVLNQNGVSFQGTAIWYRHNSGLNGGYFIRQGKSFRDGSYGFESSVPVAIYMKDKAGMIASATSGSVKIYYPGINSVKIDGASAAVISSGTGWMNVSVPSGNHSIALNGAVVPIDTVASPTFNPTAGNYTSAKSITISTATAGATIHYTKDNSTPTEASPIYTAPIAVSTATTLKAGAWKTGMTPSGIASANYTFNVADTTPPVISAISSSGVTSSGAAVSWTTNETSDSQVEYGTTTSYGSSTTLNTSLVTSHSQSLANLTPSTLYHYRVKSKDAAGNLATSADMNFTTLASSIAVNLVTNPGFESGTSPWTFYTNGTGSYTVGTPAYAGTKGAKATLTTIGTNMQLYESGISLEPNTRYRLTFAAYSSTGHDMKINLIKHISPYTNYGLTYVPNLTTSWQTFSTEFTTSGFSANVADGRLQFYFPGLASAGDAYYLDEIKLEKIVTLGSIDISDIPDVFPRSDIGRFGVLETPALGSNSTFIDAIKSIINYINSAISR
ncbi:MAG: chitobiase/beta-hexosaminidase C-terminal domain-containing protein [Candidatus Paceibacterota bacterium]|jgi:hypothetical protein